MSDLYLEALLRGEIQTTKKPLRHNKNRFEIEVTKLIDSYVKEQSPEENVNPFYTPAMKTAQLREELTAEASQLELSKYLDSAFQMLESEGKESLSAGEYEAINEEFTKGLNILETIDITQVQSTDLKSVLSISDATENILASWAEKKAEQTGIETCLPLYILLSVLSPGNATYWYRAAIACHANKDYKTAIRFYNAALALVPELVEAKIFSCDCYLECNQRVEAEKIFKEIENLKYETHLETTWNSFIFRISEKLNM